MTKYDNCIITEEQMELRYYSCLTRLHQASLLIQTSKSRMIQYAISIHETHPTNLYIKRTAPHKLRKTDPILKNFVIVEEPPPPPLLFVVINSIGQFID